MPAQILKHVNGVTEPLQMQANIRQRIGSVNNSSSATSGRVSTDPQNAMRCSAYRAFLSSEDAIVALNSARKSEQSIRHLMGSQLIMEACNN
jgi:hypothetical protein